MTYGSNVCSMFVLHMSVAYVNTGPAVTVTRSLVRVQGSSIIPPQFYVKGDQSSQLLTHGDIMEHT